MSDSDKVDPFILSEIFPDALGIFSGEFAGLKDVVAQCDVVLDTNVLLLPFGSGSSSLTHIRSAYAALKAAGRLFIPDRVAREFARHRAAKVADLCKSIADHNSKVAVSRMPSFPLFEGLAAHAKAQEAEVELLATAKKYKAELENLMVEARAWGLNDPVSSAYREIFTGETIWTLRKPKEDVLKQLEHRYRHKIPPGYKDAAKDDLGIGDLLIWLTILEIGASRRKHLVFVSGDEKADWQHRADNRGVLPRPELIDEYRRASEGCSFHIVQLSTLLELLHAEPTVVQEVQQEEQRERAVSQHSVACPACRALTTVSIADRLGSSAAPTCAGCGLRFHAHQTLDGVVAHAPHSRPRETIDTACPGCGEGIRFRLGMEVGDRARRTCPSCGSRLFARRDAEGMCDLTFNLLSRVPETVANRTSDDPGEASSNE